MSYHKFLMSFVLIAVLSSIFAQASAQPSLFDSHREASENDAPVFWDQAIDMDLSHTDILNDILYDVTFDRYVTFYRLYQAIANATQEDFIDCLERFEDLSPRGKALALLSICVNESLHSAEYASMVGMSLGDAEVWNCDWTALLSLVNAHKTDGTIAFTPINNEDLIDDWSNDFRSLFRNVQNILAKANPFINLSDALEDQESSWESLSQSQPLMLLYSILLIQTNPQVLDAIGLPQKTSNGAQSENLLTSDDYDSNTNAINDLFCMELSDTQTRELLNLVHFYLLTQYQYSRESISTPGKVVNRNVPSELSLGEIASKLLFYRERRIKRLSNDDNNSPRSATKSLEQSHVPAPESTLTLRELLRAASGEIDVFPIDALLDANAQKDVNWSSYSLEPPYHWNLRYDLTFSSFMPFHRYMRLLQHIEDKEFTSCIDQMNSLNRTERALLLSALYLRIKNNGVAAVTSSQGSVTEQEISLFERATKRDGVYESRWSTFLPTYDANLQSAWERDFRSACYRFQIELGFSNPFIHPVYTKDLNARYWVDVCYSAPLPFLYSLLYFETDERFLALSLEFTQQPLLALRSLEADLTPNILANRSQDEELILKNEIEEYENKLAYLGYRGTMAQRALTEQEINERRHEMRAFLNLQYRSAREGDTSGTEALNGNSNAHGKRLEDIAEILLHSLTRSDLLP
ncbi:MAG: hypothetical protein Q4G03_05520 [Planctomycetia bacterium]|nr:hypothetical protein [Planctomycetia bacterium]